MENADEKISKDTSYEYWTIRIKLCVFDLWYF